MQHDREYYDAQLEAAYAEADRWKEKCEQLQAELADLRHENDSLLAGIKNYIKPSRLLDNAPPSS